MEFASLPAEERYRLLVESVTDYAIYMLDLEGRVASWNRGAQRFKGYAESEIIGRHFSLFYTDQDRATDLPGRALRMAAEEGRFEQEGWRVRKDGVLIWAHVIIDPIHDDAGVLIGYAKVTRDLSERKERQEALRRSEERFRLLVQGVQDYAIYMLDPQGHVTNWNTGAQRVKGYTEGEIVGQHFSRFYTEEDRQSGLPARALKTADREGRFEQEGWRLRKDGTRFWANVVVEAIRGEQGELVGFAKVTRDVTERRHTQQALEEARARVVQSQKMEAIGQLTGGIAHDFNNLLAVVLGNLDLARKHLPSANPKLKQMVENSIQAAERGASLTRRMLAFARRQDLEAGPVVVRDLVREMSDLLQRSIGPAIRIDTQFPLRLAPAQVDPNQLELALLNLVVNARDAMPDGGTIRIGAREETVLAKGREGLEPGNYICLFVTDSGQGMDEQTLARAAEPFFTTKGVGKGTGLGLSMIHGFAAQSGGKLDLMSEPGEGTTAEIWLPIAMKLEHELPATAEAGRPRSPTRRLHVLVVDDDALVLMNTTAMLEDLGHDVLEASSGEQALRILRRSERIDLVVTDQLMPGMTGLQLIDAIRAERPAIPVILATGYSEAPTGTDVNLMRLPKPYMQSDLAQAVLASTQPEAKVLTFKAR